MKHNSVLFFTFSFVGATISSILNFSNSPALAQTSGCGSGKSWYLARVLTPVSAQQFSVACDEHDACYDTYGKSKQECDKAFHNRMLGICARDHNTWVGRPLRIKCNGIADTYYTLVLESQDAQNSYNQAQVAARPSTPNVGYFDNGVTVFYTNGTSYCGFASPNHLDFFQRVNPASNLGRRDPSSFGSYSGACPLPSGYFDNGATVFFSAGDQTFCGFPNSQAFDSHKRSRPQQPSFGRIDVDPSRFLRYTGVCQ